MIENDFKQKRQEHTVNIRRAVRQQLINKRRNLEQNYTLSEQSQQNSTLIVDERYAQQIQEFINMQYDESMFEQLIECVNSQNILLKHKGIIGFRKILARNVNPPFKKFVDRGLLNGCIQLAKQKQFPQLKLEASWILTNIASGQSQYCQKIVTKGGIDLFVTSLKQNKKGIVDQAIWGIGNLAADNVKYRDEILEEGGMDALIKIINNSQNKIIVRNGVWAVTNLCRGQPPPKTPVIKDACELLCRVIKSGLLEQNKEILSDMIWAISYMTEASKQRIEIVYKEGILDRIFKYCLNPFKQLYIPSLKIIGNFSTGNQNHTEAILKEGLFDLALAILQHPKRSMKRQMCWILSNIAAGTKSQVQAFMAHKTLLDKIAVLFHQDSLDIKRQICWIYPNFCHLGNRPEIIQICRQYDLMREYANLLGEKNTDILDNVLETLYKLILVGKKCQVEGRNILLEEFLAAGGGIRLQQLQRHQNRKVYQRAVKILTTFFQVETGDLV